MISRYLLVVVSVTMMSMNAVHGASLNLNTTEIIQANDEEVLGENLSEYTESLFATTKYVYTSDSISNEELLLVELDDEPVLDTLEMPEELEDEKALNNFNIGDEELLTTELNSETSTRPYSFGGTEEGEIEYKNIDESTEVDSTTDATVQVTETTVQVTETTRETSSDPRQSTPYYSYLESFEDIIEELIEKAIELENEENLQPTEESILL